MVEKHLGLAELLENDLSSYEYFNSLPPPIQYELNQYEINSFEEMQRKVADMIKRDQNLE